MPRVIVEIKSPTGGWHETGGVDEGTSGSLSSHEETGRQLYLFGWVKGNGPAVWRSDLGVDSDVTPEIRQVTSAALTELADLRAGSHTMAMIHPKVGHVKLRFSLRV